VVQRRLEDDLGGDEEESEDLSEVEKAPAPTFLGLQDSSDESSETSEEIDTSQLEQVLQRARDAEQKEAQKEEEEEEEELDVLLEKLAAGGASGSTSAPRSAVDGPLAVEVPKLNSALEMRQRFGARSLQAAEEDPAPQPRRRWGGAARRPAPTLLQRRLLFGAYSEEWPRPPSFVGGGIGMERREGEDGRDEFTFKYSDAYKALNESYQGILQSHDPNSLALFVGTSGSTHAQALLQLGMICAHTAQPEKAAEFVRRALAVFEAAQLEAFRPAMSQGLARMPYDEEANRPFFNALFRHAQLTHMAACSGTALEVTKLLLQLDPHSDPTCSWLTYDVYALAARDKQGLQALTRLHHSPARLDPSVSEPPPQYAQPGNGPVRSDGPTASDPAEPVEPGDEVPPDRSTTRDAQEAESWNATTTQDLLNLSFSTALALWLSEKQADAVGATVLALCKFPIMVKRLLQTMQIQTDGRRSGNGMNAGLRHELGSDAEVGDFVDWPSILECSFFREAEMRWSRPSGEGDSVSPDGSRAETYRAPSDLANKISTLYLDRLGSVWKDLVEFQKTDDLLLFAAGRVSWLSQQRASDVASDTSEKSGLDPWRIEEFARLQYSSIFSGVSRCNRGSRAAHWLSSARSLSPTLPSLLKVSCVCPRGLRGHLREAPQRDGPDESGAAARGSRTRNRPAKAATGSSQLRSCATCRYASDARYRQAFVARQALHVSRAINEEPR